jgi:RNA polymerase sigma-70 factor (ECF subfamily)
MRSVVPIPARTASTPRLVSGRVVDVEDLYKLHARTVARWAARLGGPGVDVEDVVQEVFLVAKRRLGTFTGDGSVSTWLFRATANITAAARRKQRLWRWLGRVPEAERPGLGAAGPTPVEALESREDVAAVYRALDQLPERLRRVLILFELEGLSTQEIADLMDARLSTVRVWLFRARAKFQERFLADAETGDVER